MTDEQRKEAERLDYSAIKDQWQRSGGESGTRLENYTNGYAAGRETMKDPDRYLDALRIQDAERALETERARSLDLIQAVERAADEAEHYDVLSVEIILRKAIANFEADRD